MEYEVDPGLKERFIGEKERATSHIDMKIKDVEMSCIQDSFKINYARYLEFKPNTNETNIKYLILTTTGTKFPTVGHIVLMSQLLCYFKLNFVNLSYGN